MTSWKLPSYYNVDIGYNKFTFNWSGFNKKSVFFIWINFSSIVLLIGLVRPSISQFYLSLFYLDLYGLICEEFASYSEYCLLQVYVWLAYHI